TPEEDAKRKRKFEELSSGLKLGGRKLSESSLTASQEKGLDELFPTFLDEASQATDLLYLPEPPEEDIEEENKEEEEEKPSRRTVLPIERRKKHKIGHTDLPGRTV